MLTLRRGLSFACSLLAPLAIAGCATAVDDYGYPGSGDGDDATSRDDARTLDAGGGSDSSVGPGTDTAVRSDSITSGVDTREGADTGVADDTAVADDTYTEPPDTYVEPPDTSVGPGGPCDWCSEGSCTVLDEDLDCFYECVVFEGHLDCRYDKSKSPVCLCTD